MGDVDEDALRAAVGTSVLRFIADVVLHNVTVAQRLGMNASDLQLMSLLNIHGPMTPGRLAELSGLATGTVTGVIDRMERVGFARRERDTVDRRKVLVLIDDSTVPRMAEHYREHGEHMAEVLARRDPGQLRVILDFLDEMTGGPADGP